MNNDSTQETASPVSSVNSPIYMVQSSDQEDGIDLMQIGAALWRGRSLIALITFLVVGPSLAYAFLAAPVYRAEAVLIPNERENSQGLPAGMSGLAGLAGINIGSSVNTTEVVATLRSRVFIEEFINDEKLLPMLFASDWDAVNESWNGDDPEDWPDIRDAVKLFDEEIRFVDESSTAGLVTLAIEWTDAELVAQWVDKLITRVNERLRARDIRNSEQRLTYLNAQLQQANLVELRLAISRLVESEIQTITLAQAEAEYAFKTIDPPRVPIEPVAPMRILIAVLSTVFGLFFGVFAVLLRAAIKRPISETT